MGIGLIPSSENTVGCLESHMKECLEGIRACNMHPGQ